MKQIPIVLIVALLMTGCGDSDGPKSNSEKASFNPSQMAKSEACGNGLSKQAEYCSNCEHPNHIPITVLKEKAEKKKRLV